MNEIILQIKNYIRSAWRFRWPAVMLAWVVALIGWASIFVMPDKYESEAKVYVDTESVLRPLLEGLAVQNDMKQRLHLMTRTLLSHENLQKLILQTDLDHLATNRQEREQLISRLRNTIVVDVNRRTIPGTRGETENFYTIRYTYKDRFMAQKVVKVLLDIFVESALGDTRIESDAAQKFLTQQIREYEARLTEAENKLTEFKRQNVDTLPREGGGIFQRLETTKTGLEDIQLELKEARIRRDELKRQYSRTLAEEERRRASMGVSANADSPTAQRLLAMQTRLDELLLRYTEQHPNVQEIKQTIADLKKQAEDSPPVVVSTTTSSNNVSSALEQLKLAYRESEVELRTVRLRHDEYQARVNELKEKLDTMPKVEAELTRLNRDYSINKENYQELVQRLESAKMSEQADEAGDNLKFRIVEPPSVPILPIGPKRLLLTALALFMALAIGGGLAFLLSLLKPVYFDMRTLRTELEFPVLGQVTRVMTDDVKMKRRLEISGFVSVVVLLILLFIGIVLIHVMGMREDIILLIKQSGILSLFRNGS
ncbi:MAG: chain length-determining protein [gamma proteobacterium symbiont of Ctena orbiculata]|nr:MAG: chain length-determining protein [gamma proteobacterium symbiont of Ctena orbiculata]PVV21424.1 MAG: chain length-determining protein [gamma proteobacterium symbiont of Ctena orbiculata]